MKSKLILRQWAAPLLAAASATLLAGPNPPPEPKPALDVIVENGEVYTSDARRQSSNGVKLRRKGEGENEAEWKWTPKPDGKFSVPLFGHPAERASRGAMVIRNSSTDAKVVSQIQEDLAVMARLLEKSANEAVDSDDWNVLGIKVLTLGGRDARNLYLEDYGVILSMRVNLLLVPEGTAAKDAPAAQDETDEAWEEARNEVLGGPRRREAGREKHGRKRDYDAKAVDELKGSLIEALRNAAKIRHLKESDWITLVVHGRGGQDGGDYESAFRLRFNDRVIEGPFEEAEGQSTMVLRVKKSDVDEFARKKGGEGFEKKVSITVY